MVPGPLSLVTITYWKFDLIHFHSRTFLCRKFGGLTFFDSRSLPYVSCMAA